MIEKLMNSYKKGFSLIEAIFGVFIISLIIVCMLPALNTSYLILHKAKDKSDMVYLTESIFESLKASHYNNPEYLEELLSLDFLEYKDIILIDESRYECYIRGELKNNILWNIEVELVDKKYKGMVPSVKIKGSLPKI